MIALKIKLREDWPDGVTCVCVCVCVWFCFYCLCLLQSVSPVAHVIDCIEDRSERRSTWRWHVCVWLCCCSIVGRCYFDLWIRGIRNLCKLFIHFKHCRKSLFITFRHSETSDGGGVRGFVSIACVCILQSVSRVAHVNDYIEDRSERNLTWRWHLCVCGFVSIACVFCSM